LLKKRGHTVAIANNGLEAIDKLGHEDFDIVPMDIQMSEMDGFETTRIIRNPSSHVRNNNITVIAMTARAMKGYREKCIEGGMNDYVSKPLSKEELFNKIEGIKIERKKALGTKLGGIGSFFHHQCIVLSHL
jgi:CheY-like chemotaxis protein